MKTEQSISTLYALEAQSSRNSVLTRCAPGAKMIVTLCFLVCVASFSRHSLSGLMPFVFYPLFVQIFGEIPLRFLRLPLLTALPFCLMAALSTLVFERSVLLHIGGVAVTAGAVGFCVILVKTLLCVWAVLLLAATTPLSQLSGQLLRWHVPPRLVLQLSMTYRYLFLLAGEARRMQTAYRLRGGQKSIAFSRMGAFVGTLLLRSTHRARRVGQAMQCRGYTPGKSATALPKIRPVELVCAGALCAFFILARMFNFSVLLGNLWV